MVSSIAFSLSRLGPSHRQFAHGTRWCRLPALPGLRVPCNFALAGSGRESSIHGGCHSRVGDPRTALQVVSSTRRQGRTELDGEDDGDEFEPDMDSLKSGFSKKFPGKAPPGFSYDWNLDAENDDPDDDGVQVQSFRGSDHGRAQAVGYTGPARLNARRSTEPSLGSRPGKPRESQRAYEPGKFRKDRNADSLQQNRVGQQRVVDGGRSREGSGSFSRQSYGKVQEKRNGDKTAKRSPYSKASATDVKKEMGRVREYDNEEGSTSAQNFEDARRKKKPVIEPVNFMTPMTKNPHVAILGGGMSGLVCALTLERHGIQSTVFDTGKHGLGGRMGTRFVEETQDGHKLVFDHGAQFFTVTNPRFQELVDRWITEGAAKEWEGKIGKLKAGGRYSELPSTTRYIGTNGMRSLADSMLSQSKNISVKAPCWISHMTASDAQWRLAEGKETQGQFDVVVIAHNGKCANRLLLTAHVPLVARQMKRLELSSIWSLIAAFDTKLSLPGHEALHGAFVEGIDSLSWMGNNTDKLVPASDDGPECWTFLSSAAYGKKNKVPQESIPTAKARKVQEDILKGVGTALGLEDNSMPVPIFSRLQLWGAALPTNTPSVPCIFEAQSRVGICGDWLIGSSLEAAAMSGMALADHIANYRDNGEENPEDYNVGLQHALSTLQGGHDIGQFPGSEESFQQPPQKELAAVA